MDLVSALFLVASLSAVGGFITSALVIAVFAGLFPLASLGLITFGLPPTKYY
jgi:hypothetical protein